MLTDEPAVDDSTNGGSSKVRRGRLAAHWDKWGTGWRSWVRDLAFVLVLLSAISWWRSRDLVEAGGQMPAFVVTDLQGVTHQSSEFLGKTLHVHFWATWCTVCKTEFGALSSRAENLGDDEALLAVALDSGSLESLRAFAAERELKYPIYMGDDAMNEAFRVRLFPTSYYVSADGTINEAHAGRETRLGMAWRLWRASQH